jgi:MYXO-CTERM domain-containing protein
MKCYGIGLFWYDSCDQKGEIVLVCDHECAGDHCVEPPGPEPLDEVLSPEAAEADASPQVDTSGHPVGDDAADSGAAAEGAVMSAGPKDGSCSTGSAPASGLTFLLAGLILAVVAARGCRRRPRWGSGA